MHTEINLFFKEIERIYSSNQPLVVYRKPNTKLVSAYFQDSEKIYELKSFNEIGFVFAPFNKDYKRIIFPKDKCKVITTLINSDSEVQVDPKTTSYRNFSMDQEKKRHIQLVQKTIDFIKRSNAEKIVVSRKEILKFSEFDVINTLKRMLIYYTNAFVYLWYHPIVGLWMGATPERLINIGHNKFETMALAGTQPYIDSNVVNWNDKEKREQQIVTDFILDKIKDFISEIRIEGPITVRAGNLLHLRTDISGNIQSADLLESLINSLYPTPAVCGFPRGAATNFILQNEGYNRTFYSGFLGELNMDGSTTLFVNLRCMQLKGKECSVYVGGGITSESNPENEWEETVFKTKVIKKVF